ncbi:hypothetical protein [Marivivens sp. JLT3646]|uniref:hypothetical protein n=1 Tax=Marivivens sp. JLT3646 TaxID=1920883 RepID=UPI0007FBB185|nr:hypothetical protein [Marivivens sp. JLT3646]APO88550.1 hypothetical protein BSK21_15510 [Marivivens sp. JLT3646]OBR39258.1 hypothetical protein A9199_12365 [Donghicola sp. JL3646]
MSDNLFIVISTLIGLILFNGLIFSVSHICKISWLERFPIEIRYVFGLTIVLLIFLNANQFISGNVLYPIFAASSAIVTVLHIRRVDMAVIAEILKQSFSLFLVQIIVIIAIYFTFHMDKFWLLEASNHDSIVYYQGMLWSLESPLFVARDVINERWGLGVCGEGGGWIGYDCPLYRGGTYTLAGWLQYFSPVNTANGLYLLFVYWATIVWFAVRLLPTPKTWRNAFALVLVLSTGAVGALINSNLATVMGESALLMVVAVALRKDIQIFYRYGVMAGWAAIGAHFYAESVFYTGLFIFFIFSFERLLAISKLKVLMSLVLATFILIVLFLSANITVFQAIKNLLFFSDISTGGEWFSWYLHHATWLWIGSFISGLLMAGDVSLMSVVLGTLLTFCGGIYLLLQKDSRSATFSLIALSSIAVLYVITKEYQYGEHKIVHLIGPAWSYIVAVAVLKLFRIEYIREAKFVNLIFTIFGVSMFTCLTIISVQFSANAVMQLYGSMDKRGIDFGINSIISHIMPGETVLIDDSAWISTEKFLKGHYLTLLVHDKGAQVLMPEISSDILRGGYWRNSVNNTLMNANKVDWLVKARGSATGSSRLDTTRGELISETADYQLYRANELPLVSHGKNWYDCEVDHCWTDNNFELEIFNTDGAEYNLTLEYWSFSPPLTGTVSARTSDGELLGRSNANQNALQFKVPSGWSKITVSGDWLTASPKSLGLSGDNRKLFLAITKISFQARNN